MRVIRCSDSGGREVGLSRRGGADLGGVLFLPTMVVVVKKGFDLVSCN